MGRYAKNRLNWFAFIRARSNCRSSRRGGIFDAESAREKLDAGAQLLQIYTGYIYRGPGLIREITRYLLSR